MRRSESDVPLDDAVANSREAGGDRPDGEEDTHSTTGTTENEEFVGRVTGQDATDVGETGAEARAEAEQSDD
jgi:hypothetical protein